MRLLKPVHNSVYFCVGSFFRIWVNGNPAEPTDSVTAQDEIALLPPVSGGSVNYDSLNEQYSGLHIAILSLHTSLAQPGTGDSGGMNIYIREVASALAHRGQPAQFM